MQFLGSIAFFCTLMITGCLWCAVIFLCWPLPRQIRFAVSGHWALTNMRLLKLFCRLSYEVEGAENIPPDGSYVILAKHQSAWETIAMQVIFPPFLWVLKRELLWVPIFGWALAALESIAINRKAGRRAAIQVMTEGSAQLARGRRILIFPEGTRVSPGERHRYGQGGARLAVKAGVPVVPVCHNAGEYWRKRGVIKYPGVIRVVVGKPIETTGRNAAEVTHEVEEWIEGTLETISTQESAAA